MPPAGTALQVQNNYGPTGSVEIAQIAVPIPQDMILTGANANSANAVVWQVWNDIYTGTISVTTSPQLTNTAITTGTSMTNTINAQVWGAWNAQVQQVITSAATQHIGQPINATTSGSIVNTVNAALWSAWNLSFTTDANLRQATAEQVREANRRAEEQRQRYQQDQARVQLERSLAEKRAEKLLQETLSPQQREELAAKGFFTLRTIAKSGEERIYRIRRGRSRNVEQVDASGRRLKTLCAHPQAMVPDADTMLAQKLMLEAEEEEFLRIANHS